MIKFGSNWKEILVKSWSIRFSLLSSFSSGILVILYIAPDLVPKSWKSALVIAALVFAFNVVGTLSRLTYQKDLDGLGKK